MTESKKMGINLEFFIVREDDISITDNEMDKFHDEFVELVEKYNWICGGGVKLMDANAGEDLG